MASSFNAGTSNNIVRLVETVAQAVGQDFDFAQSKSLRVTLETTDGQNLIVRGTPLDQGASFRTTIVASNDLDVPSGGGADADAAFGTGTMASSFLDVTVPSPAEGGEAVPSDAILYAMATSPVGAKALTVTRLDASTIRVSSRGPGYVGPTEVDTARATLIAGTLAVTLPSGVATTDLLFVEQITAGGGAADHFSAVRLSATQVTVQAHDAAGALVATNTSVVRVHKFTSGMNAAGLVRTTLVAGVGNVTLTNAVGDRLLVRLVTSGGTAASHYDAFRTSGTNVRIHAQTAAGALQTASTSIVEVYNLGPVTATNAVCVAGTIDALITVAAADRLSVVEVTSGGTAAAFYSVSRKNATEVTVFAHQASGAVQTLSTSTVRVYNHGQAVNETSDIAWIVRRP